MIYLKVTSIFCILAFTLFAVTGCDDDEIIVMFDVIVIEASSQDTLLEGDIGVTGYMSPGIGTSGQLYTSRKPLINGRLEFTDQIDDRVEFFIFDYYHPGRTTSVTNTDVIGCPGGTINLFNPSCEVNEARTFDVEILLFN
jgi:hypothetical protein